MVRIEKRLLETVVDTEKQLKNFYFVEVLRSGVKESSEGFTTLEEANKEKERLEVFENILF